MLHLIPRPLHRFVLRAAHALRQRWRRHLRLPIQGVTVFVTDLEGRLLLVRHSYGSGSWALPGGGMRRDEKAEDAATREIAEEVGCRLEGARVLEALEETLSGAPHTAWLVAGRTPDWPRPDRREILEARFFPTHSLPEPLTRLSRRRIEAWRGQLR